MVQTAETSAWNQKNIETDSSTATQQSNYIISTSSSYWSFRSNAVVFFVSKYNCLSGKSAATIYTDDG